MSDFEYGLADFKAYEAQTDAAILLQDTQLLKYAALWKPSMVQRLTETPIGVTLPDYWDCVQVNYKHIADMADEPENRARFQVRRLMELQLIYPDGTRSQLASIDILKFMRDRLA